MDSRSRGYPFKGKLSFLKQAEPNISLKCISLLRMKILKDLRYIREERSYLLLKINITSQNICRLSPFRELKGSFKILLQNFKSPWRAGQKWEIKHCMLNSHSILGQYTHPVPGSIPEHSISGNKYYGLLTLN